MIECSDLCQMLVDCVDVIVVVVLVVATAAVATGTGMLQRRLQQE